MIGISLGTMNTSVAYSESSSQSTKFIADIILSETSTRIIPTVVAYSKSHRMIGEHATMTFRKHINATFMYLNRLIGMKANTEYSKREIELCLAEIEFNKDLNDEFVYKIPLKEEETFIPSESLVAAFINKIKQDLIINLHKKECFAFTFAVPDFMTLGQREAVGRALNICDIDNYNIINESSAMTLYYGYSKYKTLFVEENSDLSKVGINPNIKRYVIFVDFGHGKTSFILSELRPQFFRVMNVQTDPFLGGRDFDKIIYNHLCGVFYKQNKIDLTGNKKSSLKLMEQITKARKILTANQETLINIDCLYEDYDFSYLLRRTEFETLIKPHSDKFAASLENFYKTSVDIVDKPIYAIEMAGGCMRTPILQQIVKNATGKDLQKSIIVDEAVSKGCTMYTALIYNSFPLQSFNGVYHFNPYTIVYKLDDNSVPTVLVNRSEPIPITKFINCPLKQGQKILRICFCYIKDEVEYILGSNYVITELNVDLPELISVNKLTEGDLAQGLIFEMLVDNSGKIHLQNIKISAEKNLTLDMNILCMNPKYKNILLYPNSLIKNRADEISLINTLKSYEIEHFQQDEYVKELHLKKNQLEANVYKLKSKYLEKDKEYEKLHHAVDEHLGQPRTFLSRLNSVEMALQGSDSVDESKLEKADAKIRDLEKFLSRKKTEESRSSSSQKKSLSHQEFNDKLNFYSELVDKEYVKLLEGKQAKFDERTITLISEILSKFRMLMNASEESDVKQHLMNFEKEMKKYF